MTDNFLTWYGRATIVTCSSTALVSSVLVALLLLCVRPFRDLAINIVCHIYVAIFHWPFHSSPTDYLYSAHEAPLPSTNSIWSRIQASTTLKWRARRRGLRHEQQIDWSQDVAVKIGDMIEAWDRIVEWDQRCLHPHKLEQLRSLGDPLADRALDQINSAETTNAKQSSTDTLRRIYDQACSHDTTLSSQLHCASFWKAVDRRPPPGAGALGLDWYESQYGADAIASLDQWPRYSSTRQEEPIPTPPAWSPRGAAAIDAQDLKVELEAEAEILRRGKDVFYRYAGPMLTVLLHFSLAGGFASPRITQVLRQTAYLVPTANAGLDRDSKPGSTPCLPTVEELRRTFKMDKARADRTWNRLLETTQFVLDVVEKADSLVPPSTAALSVATSSPDSAPVEGRAHLWPPETGGDGWQSAVRVRLLHANVRRRVLKLVEKRRNDAASTDSNMYDVDKNGIPINQEDLLGTLCAFSSAPLSMLQRIGVGATAQERNDYIALWRHVGFYMGLEPALLRRTFQDAQAADRTLWCTVLHLFSQVEVVGSQLGKDTSEASAGPRMQGPTIPVLIACADRPPFHTPLSAHVAISRRLLGRSLADSLCLPASSVRREVLSDIALMGMQVPIVFGRIYPRACWEKRRVELTRPLLRRLIVWSFGNKRTKFEMPSARDQTHQRQYDGETANVETRSQAYLDVPEDKEKMIELAREWRWLMREMVVVLVGTGFVAVTLGTGAYMHLRHGFGLYA